MSAGPTHLSPIRQMSTMGVDIKQVVVDIPDTAVAISSLITGYDAIAKATIGFKVHGATAAGGSRGALLYGDSPAQNGYINAGADLDSRACPVTDPAKVYIKGSAAISGATVETYYLTSLA